MVRIPMNRLDGLDFVGHKPPLRAYFPSAAGGSSVRIAIANEFDARKRQRGNSAAVNEATAGWLARQQSGVSASTNRWDGVSSMGNRGGGDVDTVDDGAMLGVEGRKSSSLLEAVRQFSFPPAVAVAAPDFAAGYLPNCQVLNSIQEHDECEVTAF
jgi:hypothetical protein